MEQTSRKYKERQSINWKFVHFDNKDDCDMFASFLGKKNIRYKCCNGMGCCVKADDRHNSELNNKINFFKNHFAFGKSSNQTHDTEEEALLCSVCYEINDKKTICGHLLCNKCSTSLLKQECPICRNPLVIS